MSISIGAMTDWAFPVFIRTLNWIGLYPPRIDMYFDVQPDDKMVVGWITQDPTSSRDRYVGIRTVYDEGTANTVFLHDIAILQEGTPSVLAPSVHRHPMLTIGGQMDSAGYVGAVFKMRYELDRRGLL